jgi:hypothetical protein
VSEFDITDYRGLRCNVCRAVIGYTKQPPDNLLAETDVLCRCCFQRHVAAEAGA